MANDDGILTLFTRDFGKVLVFVSKLANSKKKRADIDYFRRLECQFWFGGATCKLRSVSAQKEWLACVGTYQTFQHFSHALKRLNVVFPEEKADPDFFNLLIKP